MLLRVVESTNILFLFLRVLLQFQNYFIHYFNIINREELYKKIIGTWK